MRSRPMTDDYIPHFERYITLVPDGYICDMPGMREVEFTRTPFEQILSDFRIVREATVSLMKALSEDTWSRCCAVWENPTSARAFAYIMQDMNFTIARFFRNAMYRIFRRLQDQKFPLTQRTCFLHAKKTVISFLEARRHAIGTTWVGAYHAMDFCILVEQRRYLCGHRPA